MKNTAIIILLVISFFALLFSAYVIGFKLYFSSSRMISSSKRFTRMVFQRDIKVSEISFSPFGSFETFSFAMAAKGGFDKGTLVSVNKVKTKLSLPKLLRREAVLKETVIDGVDIKLNLSSDKNFNYANFFTNAKYLLMSKSGRFGLLKSFALENLSVTNSSLNLILPECNILLSDMFLISEGYSETKHFEGKGSFIFNNGPIKAPAEFNFKYDEIQNAVLITDLSCPQFSLSAEGKIIFNDDGTADAEYTAKVNKKRFYETLTALTGVIIPVFDAENSGFEDEDIIITYP